MARSRSDDRGTRKGSGQLRILLHGCAARGRSRLPARGHQGAGDPQGPPSGTLDRHDPRLRLHRRLHQEGDGSRGEDRRQRETVPRGRHGRGAGTRRGRGGLERRLLHTERLQRSRDSIQAHRHEGHHQGGQMELPVHRMRQVVQGEDAGVPDLRVADARPQEEAIRGRCACT